MEPIVEHTHDQWEYWSEFPRQKVVFTSPGDPPGCVPCPAIVTKTVDGAVVRVAWKPNEIELAQLARGGTIWLSTWGGLPAHMLEVQPPGGDG